MFIKLGEPLMHSFDRLSPRSLLSAAVLAVGLATGGAVALAQEEAAQEEVPHAEDPVVATVNGSEIHYSDVIRSAQNLPAQYQQNLAQIFPALVQRLIDMRLMEDRGREEGLADDEQVRQRVAQAESEAISQLWLQQRLETAFTEEALDEAYDRWLEENPPQDEVKARHILVEEEEQARDIIAELDAGADFAELAEEHSTDPSAEGRGGDLGFFTRDRMVAPFAEAAFAMEPGTHSSEPVETQFGWHVILVEERREGSPPGREAIEGELQEMIASDIIDETRTELRESAEIEINEFGAVQAPAAPPAD